MTKSALINAREVAEILGTSKSHAYKMVQKLGSCGIGNIGMFHFLTRLNNDTTHFPLVIFDPAF